RDAQGNVMAVYKRHFDDQGLPGGIEANDILTLSEHHIYGSDRMGLQTYDKVVASAYVDITSHNGDGTIVGNWQSPTVTVADDDITITQGDKYYELANHLGNVLVVITNRHIPVDVNADFDLEYYTADVVSYSDYYPFGSLMPGRNYNTPNYRYGFQGQEKDDEAKGSGNSINYKYRMHDPRLGRFLSIDPFTRKYPFYSPYAFSGNRVIDAIEYEGLQPLTIPNPGGTGVVLNPTYQQVRQINLPDGTSVPIYQFQNNPGILAITPQGRDAINSFQDQGFSATNQNQHDELYTSPPGQDVQVRVGVGGVSDPDDATSQFR